jgi:hypothetical protein
MHENLNPEDLKEALHDLASEDAAVSEGAIQRLRGLVARAAKEETAGADPEIAGGQRPFDEARHRILNRPEIASALIGALEAPSARVRAKAALLLWHVDSSETESALIHHVRHDAVDHVRMICVRALGDRRSPAVWNALVQALRDPQEKVVSGVCIKLGVWCAVGAVEPLQRLLDHPAWHVRYRSCQSLINLDAVDERLIAALETLVSPPEAAMHDEIIVDANEHREELGLGPEPWLTCAETLEQARRMFEGAIRATRDA